MKSGKRYIPVLFVVLLVVATSCSKNISGSGSIYVPTTANVTANATLAELQQGRVLYLNNCGTCHQLYMPESYSPAQWKSILVNMAPRTSMSSAQIVLVTKFVAMGKQ